MPMDKLCTPLAESDIIFIPEVGWCSRMEDGASERYRIMFLDGVCLNVEVPQGIVEMVSPSGQARRFQDGVWDRVGDVRERMKIFGKVVKSFATGV